MDGTTTHSMALELHQQAVQLAQRARHILLITREHASVDSISAIVAFGLVLQKQNKTFDAVVPGWRTELLPDFLSPSVCFLLSDFIL